MGRLVEITMPILSLQNHGTLAALRKNGIPKASNFLASNGFLICICITGILLRLAVYIHNRPFWTDEAQLALNIRTRSMLDLLGHLDYCQAAPPGFLLLEKSLVMGFGESELVLRFLPLLAGICALTMFTIFARQVLKARAAALSSLLFASSEALIRYSTEFKQYSVDVLFALLIWQAVLPTFSGARRSANFAILTLLAIIAPWFSFSSIIVLAAVLGIGTAVSLSEKQRTATLNWVSIWGLFGSSLSFVYYLSLSAISGGPCKDALMDQRAVPPHDLTAIGWFSNKVFDAMQFPGGFAPLGTGVALLCLIIGFWQLRQRRPLLVTAICLPIAMTVLGAWFSIYPFFGRFLLFLVPVILLLVAEGAQWLHLQVRGKAVWISACIVTLLLWPRLDFVHWKGDVPLFRQTEVRSALKYIQQERKAGDQIYVYYGAYFPAMYYCRAAGIAAHELIIGTPGYWWNSNLRTTLLSAWAKTHLAPEKPDAEVFESYRRGDFSPQWSVFESDVKRLSGRGRVWILFSLTDWLGSDEEKVFLYFLDQHGTWLETKKLSGASVYLYDFPVKHVLDKHQRRGQGEHKDADIK